VRFLLPASGFASEQKILPPRSFRRALLFAPAKIASQGFLHASMQSVLPQNKGNVLSLPERLRSHGFLSPSLGADYQNRHEETLVSRIAELGLSVYPGQVPGLLVEAGPGPPWESEAGLGLGFSSRGN
jgi:hypothetical protein